MGCQGNSSVNNRSNLVNQANVIIKSNTSSSQHYSGSTSSVTASPSSPPHSHSTEGGDHQSALEICEESDRYASHIFTLNHNFSSFLIFRHSISIKTTFLTFHFELGKVLAQLNQMRHHSINLHLDVLPLLICK